MTTDPIVESKMIFGPYATGDCFHIEKSNLYRNVRNGVQMVEFLLLRKPKNDIQAIWLIEAKSSTPMPETQPGFTEFIDEIRSKMTNGLLLYLAARLQRHRAEADELPDKFNTPDLKSLGFRFVLVINGINRSGFRRSMTLYPRH